MQISARVTVLSCLFATCSAISLAQDAATKAASDAIAASKEDNAAKELTERRYQHLEKEAKAYRGSRDSDNAKLRPMRKPLLRWTNPYSGVKAGLLVGWEDDNGIPVAIAQMYLLPFGKNLWAAELQSLSQEAFELRVRNDLPWHPKLPGVNWAEFPGKQVKPHSKKSLRLAQMRNLARRIRGDDHFENKKRESVLELLSTPVVEYEHEESGLIHGAIFVLAHGTDPEIIVMIEARKENGKELFRYALAPMTGYELRAFIGDTEVWHKPEHRDVSKTEDVFVMRGVPKMKE